MRSREFGVQPGIGTGEPVKRIHLARAGWIGLHFGFSPTSSREMVGPISSRRSPAKTATLSTDSATHDRVDSELAVKSEHGFFQLGEEAAQEYHAFLNSQPGWSAQDADEAFFRISFDWNVEGDRRKRGRDFGEGGKWLVKVANGFAGVMEPCGIHLDIRQYDEPRIGSRARPLVSIVGCNSADPSSESPSESELLGHSDIMYIADVGFRPDLRDRVLCSDRQYLSNIGSMDIDVLLSAMQPLPEVISECRLLRKIAEDD